MSVVIAMIKDGIMQSRTKCEQDQVAEIVEKMESNGFVCKILDPKERPDFYAVYDPVSGSFSQNTKENKDAMFAFRDKKSQITRKLQYVTNMADLASVILAFNSELNPKS